MKSLHAFFLFSALSAVLAGAAQADEFSTSSRKQWEGTTVSIGTQSWSWTETNEDGSRFLSERGNNVLQLELKQTFTLYDPAIAHSVGVKLARGRITYEGAFVDGPAVTSTTVWDAAEIYYGQARPLGDTGLEWTAGVGAEIKQRNIWNPATEKYQREDYTGALLSVGLQVPRPHTNGWFCGAGVTLTLATRANPNTQDLGFKEAVKVTPTSAFGVHAHVAYAFSPQTALELHWQQQRWGISNKVDVTDAKGAAYQLWQPASILGRATLKLSHRF